jgi:UDP-glucuronate 4-epimerase
MTVLVTGTAGFIGNALALRLLEGGETVIGLDNVNPYYDVRLKEARLDRIRRHPRFTEARIALEDGPAVDTLFAERRPRRVMHLAAQAGVRYSLSHPHTYVTSNVVGTLNILEACRHHPVEHLVFASSSSVYGLNAKMPFSVTDPTDHPISLYAATKKATEVMAHSYSHLFGIPTTGLRFFTVYGPWGRPDMALFLFTSAILRGEPIDVFNEGKMRRDFTYIDDVVEGLLRVLDRAPSPDPGWRAEAPKPAASSAPFRLYNIGNSNPVELVRLIDVLERALGIKAKKRLLPLQAGDVLATYADVSDLEQAFGYRPTTPIEKGIAAFVKWYRNFCDARGS